ncbi:hypothetical protein PENSPDRAFT_651722 [Peniophora sp. CONT]|nr:hypothetical protein PENSPDRAFT_651722 [Peniophora sp. CONT]
MAELDGKGICNTCQKWGAVLRCSQCHTAPYCNAECQKKDWKQHKKVCTKRDAAKLEYDTIVHKTVDAIAPLLGLAESMSPQMLDPGNKYLQLIVNLACILNDITTVDDSAKVTATDLRFDYRPCRCTRDPSGQWHELLQLTSVHSLTGRGAPFLTSPNTAIQRATANTKLHTLTKVYDDPTCCNIPLLFGSQKSKDTQDRTSYVKFYWVPVLPGVARKAVKEMEESGMSEEEYISELVGRFNDMIIHDKVRGAPHAHT